MKSLNILLVILAVLSLGWARLKESSEAFPASPASLKPQSSPEMQKLFDAFRGEWAVNESFEISASQQGKARRGTASFRMGLGSL